MFGWKKTKSGLKNSSSGETAIEMSVTGMTCAHCQSRVQEVIAKVLPDSQVHVDLQPGATSLVTVKLPAGQSLTGEEKTALLAGIDEAGFSVVGLKIGA